MYSNWRYRLVWANLDIPEEILPINLVLCSNRPTSPVTVTAHYNLAPCFLVFILSLVVQTLAWTSWDSYAGGSFAAFKLYWSRRSQMSCTILQLGVPWRPFLD
jgi:hypothetical protein